MQLCVAYCLLKLDSFKAIQSLWSLSSLFTSLVSTLGVEPISASLVTAGLLSPVDVTLLGMNRYVTTLNMDHIIPGCIWGSASNSLTVTMLEPPGFLTSTWCSMMGLVGVIKMGTLASIVVLFVGPVLGATKFCLWTLFHISMEFHRSESLMVSTRMSSGCERGMGFPFLSSQTKPAEDT